MAVIIVASEVETTAREAAHHFADSVDRDVHYPESQLVGHLIYQYVERHSEDFSRKPATEEGGLAHHVYLGGHSRTLAPPPEDDQEEEEEDGEDVGTEGSDDVDDDGEGDEEDDVEGGGSEADERDYAPADAEEDEEPEDDVETNEEGYETDGKLTFTMSDGPTEEADD